MKKVGIITFHNSYNCGSMLESYAIQTVVERLGYVPEIIDFSSSGQIKMYQVFYENTNIKDIVKNLLIFPRRKQIRHNNTCYEQFKENFYLSSSFSDGTELSDSEYRAVIAGSDQIWNITIPDYDDAYFLPWVKNARKIAYAPSFGAKRIEEHTNDTNKYANWINSFDALSIRERNGKQWIAELCGKNAKLLLDPTLLLNREDYERLEAPIEIGEEPYLFFYCPSFDKKMCVLVKKLSEKYNLRVYTWSAKSYCIRNVKHYGFKLVDCESPAIYLSYIKSAKLVITTSFHGTIFSTIYRKNFFVIKNGEMFGNDDRVRTLVEQLNIENRMIPLEFDPTYDYMCSVDYTAYEEKLPLLKTESLSYLKDELNF